MSNYYNEFHAGKAEVLRNMIAEGLIPDGDVDERSIEDVVPSELTGYSQCHFFAGIGIWPLALRMLGWPDTRRVWTGSCPCQPFSSAGKGAGVDDERHLFPAWFHLIEQCRPDEVLAEQVASKDGLGWLDLVQAHMEGANYSGGFLDLCAAGFGAPHIRQRLYGYFRLADGSSTRLEGWNERWDSTDERAAGSDLLVDGMADMHSNGQYQTGFGLPTPWNDGSERDGASDRMGNTGGTTSQWDTGSVRTAQKERGGEGVENGPECVGYSDAGDVDGMGYTGGTRSHARALPGIHRSEEGTGARDGELERPGDVDGVPHAPCDGRGKERADSGRDTVGNTAEGFGSGYVTSSGDYRPGPTNGFWRDADWLGCRDGKWRPVEPGSSPLAYGLPRSPAGLPAGVQGLAELAGLDAASLKRAKSFRKLALHSYGDGIVLPQAIEFIKAVM